MVKDKCNCSRIDLLLDLGGLMHKVAGVSYQAYAWSDHSLLACSFFGGGVGGYLL